MKIAILSCDSAAQYGSDEDVLIDALISAGHSVTGLPWTQDSNWSGFDRVIIRSTWDYVENHRSFLQKLEKISQESVLLNSLEVVKWNLNKRYLKALEEKGVAIVPTKILEHGTLGTHPWNKVVVKPTISNGALNTMVTSERFVQVPSGEWMIQPFVEDIREGEISLIFFGKRFSHALLKKARPGDFRVQGIHGGTVTPLEATPEMIRLGEEILEKIEWPLLYARVDLVKYEGRLVLMELELIEPMLYFGTHPEAASNFLSALEAF
jgi:glutathione synthase/RimK-type ligase-like ATP-grasp enzyme